MSPAWVLLGYAWLVSMLLVFTVFRLQRWMNRWYELSQQHARALDQVACLKELVAVYENPLRVHTAEHGAAVHGTDPDLQQLRQKPAGRVVPQSWPEHWRAAPAREPVPGLPPAGGQCAPGEQKEGRGDEAAAGDDLTVVGSTGGKVQPLRRSTGPDEIPY